MSNIQVFCYEGSNITFSNENGVMVNATEMAKQFGKEPYEWLRLQSAKDFIKTLYQIRGINSAESAEFIRTVDGRNCGTWFHEDVALEFARWLSPMFAIWCNDRIKELLTKGLSYKSEEDILCAALEIQKKRITSLEKQVKRLSSPVAKSKSKAKREQSSVDVSEWLKDQHIDAINDWCADGIWIPMVELVKNYLTYCVERKIRSLSPMILGRELNSRGYKRSRRNGRSFYYVNKCNKQ